MAESVLSHRMNFAELVVEDDVVEPTGVPANPRRGDSCNTPCEMQ